MRYRLLTISIFTGVSLGQTAPHKLSAAEFALAQKKLDPRMISDYRSGFLPDQDQAFALLGAQGPVWLVPVRYQAKASPEDVIACGLFTIRPDGATFASTYDATAFDGDAGCNFTAGLALRENGANQPPLVLLYIAGSFQGSTLPKKPADLSLALHWDLRSRSYVKDDVVDQRIERLRNIQNVLELKRAIAAWGTLP